jgi:hypothetical protein
VGPLHTAGGASKGCFARHGRLGPVARHVRKALAAAAVSAALRNHARPGVTWRAHRVPCHPVSALGGTHMGPRKGTALRTAPARLPGRPRAVSSPPPRTRPRAPGPRRRSCGARGCGDSGEGVRRHRGRLRAAVTWDGRAARPRQGAAWAGRDRRPRCQGVAGAASRDGGHSLGRARKVHPSLEHRRRPPGPPLQDHACHVERGREREVGRRRHVWARCGVGAGVAQRERVRGRCYCASDCIIVGRLKRGHGPQVVDRRVP